MTNTPTDNNQAWLSQTHLTRPGCFITGTDTDVGKTYISACLAATLVAHGITVAPRKPIASGCVRQLNGDLLSTDALALQCAAKSLEPLDVIGRYTLEPAISPHLALAHAGLNITINDLYQACSVPNNHFALIEGAGGFYSPMASDGFNKNLAMRLGYPIILVVGNQLGCINHTLLTVEAIEASGLSLLAIVVNHLQPGDFSQGLAQFTHYPIFSVAFNPSQTPVMLSPKLIELLSHQDNSMQTKV
ncbi:dethiobiotin synthase [Thiomicrorhabdus aquaedulcis]|uniref:dethiobiotin synthase n=1 Tax=Thiomicrorhabdus aquaedulcis TaxID=2211106 RepID=UPI000FDA5BF7|nr:dethiobiotin synthase [Thiomicrorhabdus aquaedulcis]